MKHVILVTLGLGLVLGILGLAPQASAYRLWGYQWPEDEVGNLRTYVYYDQPYDGEYNKAMSSWNDTSTPIHFHGISYRYEIDLNCVTVDEPDATWDGKISIYAPGNIIQAASIALNDHYCSGYPSEKVESVAAHEFGHALGLDDLYGGDEHFGEAVMNGYTDWRYEVYGIYTPQQDDINGVNYLYS